MSQRALWCRTQHSQTDEARNCRLLDGEPLRIELQQSDASGEKGADHAKRSEQIDLPSIPEIAYAPYQRETERQHQRICRTQFLRTG